MILEFAVTCKTHLPCRRYSWRWSWWRFRSRWWPSRGRTSARCCSAASAVWTPWRGCRGPGTDRSVCWRKSAHCPACLWEPCNWACWKKKTLRNYMSTLDGTTMHPECRIEEWGSMMQTCRNINVNLKNFICSKRCHESKIVLESSRVRYQTAFDYNVFL